MCSIPKSTTFRKVFTEVKSDHNLLYSHLPEKTLSDKLKKLRVQHSLSQRAFAELCNIGYQSLCNYELNSPISFDNLVKICTIFDLKITYLVDFKTIEKPYNYLKPIKDGHKIYSTLPEDTLSQRFLKYRLIHSYSKKEFALKLGLHTNTYARIENGNFPNEKLLKNLCTNVGINYYNLVT